MKAPDDYPKKEDLSQYKETSTHVLHDNGGILSMDVFQDEYLLTGGKNGEAVVFDANSHEIVNKFVPYYGNEIGLVKFAPYFSSEQAGPMPNKAIIAAQKAAFAGLWDL
jgi:hypothetical protein